MREECPESEGVKMSKRPEAGKSDADKFGGGLRAQNLMAIAGVNTVLD